MTCMDERSSTQGGGATVPAATATVTSVPVRDGAARAGATGQKARAKQESNIKETIESILVAFILAFIFRAFIVEAFVIPTGSMAPTLLGAHLRWVCPDCGYHFDTNYSAREYDADYNPIIPAQSGPYIERDRSGRVIRKVDSVHQVQCPNCAFAIPRSMATNVPVQYGDRILVLKFLYLFENPSRWDVVVFKSPYDSPKYQQNYIKRLVGRPNESVVLLDGDVYVGPADATKLEQFQIQTKPKHVQDALWRVIYDNDYHPRGMTRSGNEWKQPWTVRDGSGWNLEKSNIGAGARTSQFRKQLERRSDLLRPRRGSRRLRVLRLARLRRRGAPPLGRVGRRRLMVKPGLRSQRRAMGRCACA
jgi:signal peptidase I